MSTATAWSRRSARSKQRNTLYRRLKRQGLSTSQASAQADLTLGPRAIKCPCCKRNMPVRTPNPHIEYRCYYNNNLIAWGRSPSEVALQAQPVLATLGITPSP